MGQRAARDELPVRVNPNVVNSPELKNIIMTESEVAVANIASARPITVTVSARNSKGRQKQSHRPGERDGAVMPYPRF